MCDKHGVPPTMSTPFIQTLSPILLRPTAVINEADENEKALCCLVIADMIRHYEPIFGTIINDITKLKYGYYPTLSPAQARKLISTQIPGGIPPPPLLLPSSKTPEQADKLKQLLKRHHINREKMEFVTDDDTDKLTDAKITNPCEDETETLRATNIESDAKIIVNYQKDQQFVVNISKDNPATLTLDDFRRACDCTGGCLQDIKDPTRILIAGNIVVPPGVYQMIISHQSNMTQFNKRFSIPHTSPAFLHIQHSEEEEEEEVLRNFSWKEVGI